MPDRKTTNYLPARCILTWPCVVLALCRGLPVTAQQTDIYTNVTTQCSAERFYKIAYGVVGHHVGTRAYEHAPGKIMEAIQEVNTGGSPMSAGIARRVVQQFKHHQPANGENALTEREKQLLTLLSKGNSYKMIANDMQISVHTVQQHIKHIYTKLQVHNMGEAVAKALKNRII